MKWIKKFCFEILNKVKENIATGIVVAFFVVISFVFKKYLAIVYTFALPIWAWIAVCVAILCLSAIILKIIELRHKRKVLTDKDDIYNKLRWWLGQQQQWVREQTRDNKLVTWHFSVIDKKLGLNPGSAKKFLPEIFGGETKQFPITILKEGKETIAIRYDL